MSWTRRKSSEGRGFFIRLEYLGVLAQGVVDQEHFLRGDLAAPDYLRALEGREEIVDVELVEHLLTDAVDAAYPLDDPGRVPGDIVVDDRPGPVEVEAFGHFVGGQQYLYVIAVSRRKWYRSCQDLRRLAPAVIPLDGDQAVAVDRPEILFDIGHGVNIF